MMKSTRETGHSEPKTARHCVASSSLFKDFRPEIKQSFYLSTKMPKQKKSTDIKGKGNAHKKQEVVAEKGAVYCNAKNEIIMKIHAKPGAKESSITDISSETVGVQISAPPVDGEANKELLRYLAEVLHLKKSELSLEKGSRSKEKTVLISGASTTLDDVLIKLKAVSKQ